MTIYRVYRPYHESSESGTYEYGYYSSHDRAKQRALDVWKEKDFGNDYEVLPNGGLIEHGAWGGTTVIYVDTIEVDNDCNDNMVGYT